jgi:hypothetical protein
VWYELRRNGYIFPLTVGCLVASFVPLGFFLKVDHRLVLFIVGYAASFPLVMSQFMGSTLAKGDVASKDGAFPAFLAVRPLSTLAFVRAKLVMVAVSALAACFICILAATVLFLARGDWDTVQASTQAWFRAVPPFKVWTIGVLTPLVLFLWTWRNLAGSLWVGMSGRRWVGGCLAGVMVGGLVVLGLVSTWLFHHPAYQPLAWDLLPWLAGVFVVAKLSLAAVLICYLSQRRMLNHGQLALGVCVWLLGVCCLIGVAWWLLPPALISLFWVVCVAVYLVPFNGLALAPLALEWNRHR